MQAAENPNPVTDADSAFYRLTEPRDSRRNPDWAEGNEFQQLPDGRSHSVFFRKPFRVLLKRHQVGELIWPSTWLGLVRDDAARTLRDSGLTGFELRPTRVSPLFPCAGNVPTYWQFIVTGWGGAAPPSSGIERVIVPGLEGHDCYSECTDPSKLVDASQWDGSDFFIVWPLPRFTLVTDRVVSFFRQQTWKWYGLFPIGELQFGKPVGGFAFCPGHLRSYFDDDRARRIENPSASTECRLSP